MDGNFTLFLRLWQLSEQQMLVPSTLWMNWARCATKKASGFMWTQLMQVRDLLMTCRVHRRDKNLKKIWSKDVKVDSGG